MRGEASKPAPRGSYATTGGFMKINNRDFFLIMRIAKTALEHVDSNSLIMRELDLNETELDRLHELMQQAMEVK